MDATTSFTIAIESHAVTAAGYHRKSSTNPFETVRTIGGADDNNSGKFIYGTSTRNTRSCSPGQSAWPNAIKTNTTITSNGVKRRLKLVLTKMHKMRSMKLKLKLLLKLKANLDWITSHLNQVVLG